MIGSYMICKAKDSKIRQQEIALHWPNFRRENRKFQYGFGMVSIIGKELP